MALINKEDKLCDVIIIEPTVISVLNRFNIFLGVGDKSVEQICEEKNLDVDFFLTILNTYMNEEYFPEKLLKSFDATLIVGYLTKTNKYYQQFQIPNIERHFNLLIERSQDDNNNLSLLRKFFFEVKSELLGRIAEDSNRWFKEISELEKSSSGSRCASGEITVPQPVQATDTIEDKLGDLVSMFIKHLTGSYDSNLCLAVLYAILNLKKDIIQNDRIRNRILMPLYNFLLSKKNRTIILADHDMAGHSWQYVNSNADENTIIESLASIIKKLRRVNSGQDGLSAREIDVLKLVATGLTNKEIADRLNISINTVLSHRKNISAKLGIKSVSGLSVYAMMNGYINS